MDSLPSPVDRDLITQIVSSVYESLRKSLSITENRHTVTDSDYPMLPTVRNPHNTSSNNPSSTAIPVFRNALLQNLAPSGDNSGEVHLQSENGHDNAAIRPGHVKAEIRPIKKGEFFSIPISEELFHDSARPFLDSLIGRLIYSKGDKPVANLVLQKKLESLWGISFVVRLLPLGRGYYNFQFSTKANRDRAFLRQS